MISAVQEPPRSLDTLARRRTKCEVFFFSERPQSTLKIFIFYKKPVKPFRCTRGHCMECFLPYPKSSPPGGPGGKLNCLFTARNVVRTWKHGLPPSLKSVCRTLPPPPNRTPQPTRGFRPGGGGLGPRGCCSTASGHCASSSSASGPTRCCAPATCCGSSSSCARRTSTDARRSHSEFPTYPPPPPPGKASCSHEPVVIGSVHMLPNAGEPRNSVPGTGTGDSFPCGGLLPGAIPPSFGSLNAQTLNVGGLGT